MSPHHPFVSRTLLFPPLGSLLCSPLAFPYLTPRSFSSVYIAINMPSPLGLLWISPWIPRVIALSFPQH